MADADNPLAETLRKDLERLPHFIVLVAAVAKADGTIDDDEREVLQRAVERALGSTLAPDVVRYVVGRGLQSMEEQGGEAAVAAAGEQLAAVGVLAESLRLAVEVAGASEGIADSERAVLEAAGKAGGLSDEELAAILTG